MKTFCMALLCMYAMDAGANQMFGLQLKKEVSDSKDGTKTQLVATGESVYGRKLRIEVLSDASQSKLQSVTVTIDDVTIQVPDDTFEMVVDPRPKDLDVVNDTGIMGDYYYISIPFGQRKTCRVEGKRFRVRPDLRIEIGQGALERVSVFDLCKR